MALPFGAHVPFSTHNPSPLSFGFGLGVPQHHLPPPPDPPVQFNDYRQYASQAQPQPSSSSSSSTARALLSETPQRTSEKRRRQADEDDAAMEGGSPTPTDNRPIRKLGGAKKLRQTPTLIVGGSKQEGEDDIDIGSLLASLPPSSLLPLLTSLVEKKPELKPIVLSLIPRPTLDTALQALNEGVKRLRDAYPYSLPSSSTSAGFGFGQSSQTQQPAMRESYIRTRLRQPVREFTKLLLSYLSYFSLMPLEANASPSSTGSPQKQPKVQLHPTETFTFLHALTLQLFRLPPLTLSEFTRPAENVVFPRLELEWSAWVQKIDDDVNKWAGMYRDEVVKGWERQLDELVVAEENAIQQQKGQGDGNSLIGMRAARDRWIQRAGWLIGRRSVSVGMEY